MASLAAQGYERVKPPLVEFEDSLLADAGASMAPHTFRLMDPISQRMMGLRADMTGLRLEISGVDTRLGREIAELKGSVKHLPTAWMMITTAIGSAVIVAGGVVGGVFAALRYTGHG